MDVGYFRVSGKIIGGIFFESQDTLNFVQKKYKTEIGESMVQPSKKLKKILFIMGMTGAVYVCFQYLLPLVIPFLIAYGIALLLHPSAEWISSRCRVKLGKKTFGIPIGVIGALELMLVLVTAGIWIYIGGRKLYLEAGMLIDQVPVWIDRLDHWISDTCYTLEGIFRMKEGCLVVLFGDMLRGLVASLKTAAMPYLVVNSMTVFRWIAGLAVVWVILVIAVMLWLQEMEIWRERREQSDFRKEFAMLSRRLSVVCQAYLKTQGTIMILTMTICIIVFRLMGNPYYILSGIAIGLLDALPIFGTGTALIPWTLISCIQGKWGTAAVLAVLYVSCYLLRQILEAKMMGDKVGLSPLETLISMYVGLQLFGLLGLLLGPLGLLIIEDGVKAAGL